MTETPAGDLAAERMQRLLSRAVEEQVTEQRQAVTLLTEVRTALAGLEAGLRAAANQETVDRLDSSVSTVVADVRTSTALLSQRLEALSARVEAVAAETAAPVEQTTVRLGALAAEVSAQAAAVSRVQDALVTFEAFPAALAALQRDISGLHDRLAGLGSLQAAVNDGAARTAGALDEIRPRLEALAEGLQGGPDPERVRDAVVDALNARLVRLEEAAARPVVSPELLSIGLGDLRANVRGAVGEQLEEVTERIGLLQQRIDLLAGRIANGSSGPDLSGDLARLAERVEALAALPNQVDAALAGISALRSDTSVQGVRAALETFADGAAHLSEQVARIQVPSVDELSTVVSARVADRLVEVLAPRIADVVLTRVSAALVTQLGEAIAPRLREESDAATRAVVAESEKRVLAHVDESVLALAEALLRRKGLTRSALAPGDAGPAGGEPASVPAAAVEEAAVEQSAEPVAQEPVHEVVARLGQDEEPGSDHLVGEPQAPVEVQPAAERPSGAHASVSPASAPQVPQQPAAVAARPAVTTGLAPAPSGVAAAPAVAQAPAPSRVEEVPAQRNGGSTRANGNGTRTAAPAQKPAGQTAAKAADKPSKAPAKKPAAKPAKASVKAADKAPAKAAPRKAAPAKAARSAPAKAVPAKRPAPPRATPQQEGSLRPARPTRNVPSLDRALDATSPSPLGARPAPPAVPRQAPSVPPPPPMTPAQPAVGMPQRAPEKKRRWWRSGE